MTIDERNPMTAITPGPGLECVECSEITPVNRAAHGDPCPACGSDATSAVRIESCPVGPDCTDDNHHFGVDAHVVEVDQ